MTAGTLILSKRMDARVVVKDNKSSASLAISIDELRELNHQLRTPLARILGLTHVLEKQAKNDAQLRFAHSIETSGRELLLMIESLLTRVHPIKAVEAC